MNKLLSALNLFLFLMMTGVPSSFSQTKKVNIGGEIRIRPEYKNNSDFNSVIKDIQSFFSQRTRLNLEVKVSPGIRGYLEIQDSREWGTEDETASKATTATAGEKQALDVYQAFIEIEKVGGTPLQLKLGRQTLVYGDQRLIGHFGWSNYARTFDAVKAILVEKNFSVELFGAKMVEKNVTPGDATRDNNLYGLYATVKLATNNSIDLYGLIDKDGSSRRNILTSGLRLAGKVAKNFDYKAEIVLQSGDYDSTLTQEAKAFAFIVGYTFPTKSTWIGVEYDYGSGDDDPDDRKHKTFENLYPTNHLYYGYMDYFSWKNMTDLRFTASTRPLKNLGLQVDFHFFSLATARDAWYGAGGGVFKAAVLEGRETKAGNEIDFTLRYPYSKNLSFAVGYSLFYPGKAAQERTGYKGRSNWGYLQVWFKF